MQKFLKLLYWWYCLAIIVATFFLVVQSLLFIRNHLLLSIPTILLARLIYNKNKSIKKKLLKQGKTYVFLVLIYFYVSFVLGAPVSLEKIISTISPVNIVYDESGKYNTFVDTAYRFPPWKTFVIRLWNDLPLYTKKLYLSAHFIVESDVYYHDGPDGAKGVDNSKKVICIIKNLGEQKIILNQVQTIEIQTNGKDIKDLSNFVNEINLALSKEVPAVFYPLEEKILFISSFARTGEQITIEIEIAYSDYPGKRNTLYLQQRDMTQFKDDSPKLMSTKTTSFKISQKNSVHSDIK